MGEVKQYLLDTNVLLIDPHAIFGFQENDLYIPVGVLTELDCLKKGVSDSSRNAREANHVLDDLVNRYPPHRPAQVQGRQFVVSPEKGIPLGEGKGRLYFVIPPLGKSYPDADTEILTYLRTTAARKNAEQLPIVVTADRNLRVRLHAYGFVGQDYREGRDIRSLHELLDILETITLPDAALRELDQQPSVRVSFQDFTAPQGLFANQYLEAGSGLLVRYVPDGGNYRFNRIRGSRDGFYGIKPRNREQQYLADLCFNPDILIGTVLGTAGTGKTLIPLAAALQETTESGRYDQIIIIRPVSEVGRDLGAAPGSIAAKVAPYMAPIMDAAKVIFADGQRESLDNLLRKEKVVLESPTFMRGRNLSRTFVLVDEAQNLTRSQVKTLATRVAAGSKVVLTGDPYQIDSEHLDETRNGLVALTQRLRGQTIFGTVILKKPERGDVAELVGRLL